MKQNYLLVFKFQLQAVKFIFLNLNFQLKNHDLNYQH